MKTELDFQIWLDIFVDHLRKAHGYKGPIDNDSAKEDFENEIDPEDAADELYIELNRQD